MKKDRLHRQKTAQGFTLVELLVAIVILTLIMLGVSQLMNSTVAVTLGSFKHMDADTQARTVLDRIAFDVSRMVQRTDVDYYFPSGNSQMAFFSEASGYYPDAVTTNVPKSTVSLIGYRLNTNTNQLERLSKGLVWNGVDSSTPGASGLPSSAYPMVFLPQTIIGTWPNIAKVDNDADTDYQVIGDQIFRFEIHYLVQNSTKGGNYAAQISDIPNLDGNNTPSSIGYFNPRDVLALIVTIAVLDTNSQKSLANPTSQLQTAQAELPATSGTSLPLTKWRDSYNSTSDYLGLNKNAAAQVRFYQRYCYLNHVPQ